MLFRRHFWGFIPFFLILCLCFSIYIDCCVIALAFYYSSILPIIHIHFVVIVVPFFILPFFLMLFGGEWRCLLVVKRFICVRPSARVFILHRHRSIEFSFFHYISFHETLPRILNFGYTGTGFFFKLMDAAGKSTTVDTKKSVGDGVSSSFVGHYY